MPAPPPAASDRLGAALAEADRQRARAEDADHLARQQAASLVELAARAEELRCEVADLADNSHSHQPMPAHGLRAITTRLERRADTLARTAQGYTAAQSTDMTYPRLHDDLDAHGWSPRPAQALAGLLPPIPITELPQRRGYRRGWQRGPRQLTVWFTSPDTLAYATASEHGRLLTADEVHAVITTPRAARTTPTPVCRPAPTARLEVTYDQIAEHMRAAGWGAPSEVHPCDEHGIRRSDGAGLSAVWNRPSDPDFQVWVWGLGKNLAHARYWAGPITDMATLRHITEHR